ncbi:hypothetical protein ABPG77_000734 [Micractinium sp. CCAP 211/92]
MVQQVSLATRQGPCLLLQQPRSASWRQAKPAACTRCSAEPDAANAQAGGSRRGLLLGAATLAASSAACVHEAHALPGFKKDLTNKRKLKVPESEYTEGPDGLKYYDVVVGTGAEATEGRRVVVHFEAKWKGVTFITTRQGMGVTGGTPLGFDVGARGAGGTLKGLDLGVRGMRVGGRRKLIVPPNLAYGDKGAGEVPPGATLDFDVELLSIKQDAVGYRVKLVEG